jgi:CBS domain-containing protein
VSPQTPSPELGPTAEALARSDLLRGLPAEIIETLAAEVRRESYREGTLILRQGGPRSESLYLIDSGTVHVEAADPGQGDLPQLVEVCGEGDMFGAASVLDRASKARARFTVRAVEDVACYLIPRERVLWLVDRFPAVADAVARRNHRLLRRATAEIVSRAEPSVRGLDFGLQALVEPVGSRVRREPVVCGPDTSIADAARLMTEAGIGSIPVVDPARRPVGIVTDSDLRRTVVARARPVSDPVSLIMSSPVVTLRQVDPALEALRLMGDHGISHLVVVDENERISGVISSGDLLLVHANTPAGVLRGLEAAADLDELAAARGQLTTLLEDLVRVGVEPEKATRVITALNDRASRRALVWAEAAATAELRAEVGEAFSPPAFCWLALGSEGREEQTLATDQDNALIHAAAPDDQHARRWIERFSSLATDSLERLGFPRCPGGVMASNPHWSRSLDGWRIQVHRWIDVPDEQAMLESTIFFDFRALYGDAKLAQALRATVRAQVPRNDIYLAHLTRTALRNRPPLGLIRTFVVERGGEHRDTLNLKERGMAPLVDCARVLALRSGSDATNTFERLAAAADARAISRELAEDAREAYAFLMLVRIQHHLALQLEGRPPDNHINPDSLSSLQRRTLKVAFQVVQAVQNALSERYGGYALG